MRGPLVGNKALQAGKIQKQSLGRAAGKTALPRAVSSQRLQVNDIVEGTVVYTNGQGARVLLQSQPEVTGYVPSNEFPRTTPFDSEVKSRNPGGEVVLPVGHTRYFKVLAAHACGISPLLSAAAVDREVYMDRLQQLSEDLFCPLCTILAARPSGLLVEVAGYGAAFLPTSQLRHGPPPDAGQARWTQQLLEDVLVGKRLRLKVIQVDRPRSQVILSERAAYAALIEQLLQEGSVLVGQVVQIQDYGVFVSLDDLDGQWGLLHKSQLTQGPTPSTMKGLFQIGERVMVQVYQVTSRGEVLSGWRQKQGTANEFTSFTANRTAKGSGSDTQKGRSGFSSDEEGSYKVGSDTKRVRNVARQPQTSYEEKFTVSLSTRGLELEVGDMLRTDRRAACWSNARKWLRPLDFFQDDYYGASYHFLGMFDIVNSAR